MMSFDFGPVGVLATANGGPFTVSPAGPSTQMDDDYVYQIVFDSSCPAFALQNGAGEGMLFGSADGNLYSGSAMPPHVYWNCTTGGCGYMTACDPITYQFTATFTPQAAGFQQCVARIYTHSGSGGSDGSNTITFSGSGTQAMYAISADQTAIHFGSVPMGSTATHTVTVTNTGSGSVDVTDTNLDGTGTFLISPVSGSMITLPLNGDSQQYSVTCTPPGTAFYASAIHFTTPSGQGGIDVPVTVDCTGIALQVGISPNPIDFGTNLLHGSAVTRMVTITNNSSTSFNVSGFGFMGSPPRISYFGVPGTATIVSGGSVNVTVKYDPSAEDTSGSLGAMTFTAGTTPLSVPIIGKTLIGSLGANPAAVDFGPVCAGGNAAMDVTIMTNADGPVTVNPPVAPPAAPFTATATTSLPKQLGAGGQGSITVHATVAPPSTFAAGPVSSMFGLSTNIPAMATVTVPLTATVLAGGASPTPTSLSFGPVMVDGTSQGKTVTLTNCGGTDLTINDARVTGASPNDFTIAAPANYAMLNKTLHQGESQMFLVQLTPRANGDKTATMLIEYADGSFAQVPLDGAGFGGSGSAGSAKDRETYYACGAGRPIGLLPFAFVLLVWRRRIRR